MNTIYLSDLDKKESLFHFTNKESVPYIFASGGLVSKIGENSLGIEGKEKIFFSKGYIGVLQLIDVWLKWEMTRFFGFRKKCLKKEWNSFYEDWYSGLYKEKEEYLNYLFESLYEDFKNRRYFNLLLEEGVDYNPNEFDDVKVRMNKSEELKKQLFLIYGSYSNINDYRMEKWNMFTRPKSFIPIEKMQLVSSNDDEYDALSIILAIYDRTDKKFISFDLLDKFIDYAKKRRKEETKAFKLNI